MYDNHIFVTFSSMPFIDKKKNHFFIRNLLQHLVLVSKN